ncbi:MAG: hypothetical protein K2J41_09405, partial [Eubacterium sp.]|nr:hypothetical protein [Eubacterium sp.]
KLLTKSQIRHFFIIILQIEISQKQHCILCEKNNKEYKKYRYFRQEEALYTAKRYVKQLRLTHLFVPQKSCKRLTKQ